MLNLFDPDSSFGALSNNYPYAIVVDGKLYSSVANYIYSNMTDNPLYSTILRTYPPMGQNESSVKKTILFRELLMNRKLYPKEKQELFQEDMNGDISKVYRAVQKEEYVQTARRAINTAYNVLRSNEEFKSALLATGDAELLYISKNDVLGITELGYGQNLIGSALELVRASLRQEIIRDEIKERNAEVVVAYHVYRFLMNEMEEGRDIKRFVGKSYREIAESESLQPKHSETLIFEEFESGSSDLSIYKAIEDETSMALNLRNRFASLLKKGAEKAKMVAVFKAYAKSVLAGKYTPEQIESLVVNDMLLVGGVYKLYVDKVLKLDVNLREFDISDEDIAIEVGSSSSSSSSSDSSNPIKKAFAVAELAESAQPIVKAPKAVERTKIKFSSDTSGEYGKLSPMYVHKLFIDNSMYPSVSKYVITELLGTLIGEKKAREVAYNRDVDEIGRIYTIEADKRFVSKYTELNARGLSIKFANPALLELLRLTGDATLEYEPSITAEYLTKLRTNRIQPPPILGSIPSIITNDSFLTEWFVSFNSSTCLAMRTVWGVMEALSGIAISPTAQSAYSLTSSLYQVGEPKEKSDLPLKFVELVMQTTCFKQPPLESIADVENQIISLNADMSTANKENKKKLEEERQKLTFTLKKLKEQRNASKALFKELTDSLPHFFAHMCAKYVPGADSVAIKDTIIKRSENVLYKHDLQYSQDSALEGVVIALFNVVTRLENYFPDNIKNRSVLIDLANAILTGQKYVLKTKAVVEEVEEEVVEAGDQFEVEDDEMIVDELNVEEVEEEERAHMSMDNEDESPKKRHPPLGRKLKVKPDQKAQEEERSIIEAELEALEGGRRVKKLEKDVDDLFSQAWEEDEVDFYRVNCYFNDEGISKKFCATAKRIWSNLNAKTTWRVNAFL
jgi:predicted NAD-dependent protein-ADP-ribosyltransferase YbiA (DUF1768 family)